jgi:hypothetical protein
MSDELPSAHVAHEETLHRVVAPGSDGPEKPHYMAFYSKTEPHRISVDRATYRTIDQTLESRPWCGAAALNTGAVRELEFEPRLIVESKPENGNDAHSEIVADTARSPTFVKTKVCAKLADISKMVRQPPPRIG